ncbi:MAG TPA: DUF742 domain-containing protein [Micromonosporaceae bacterium]|nr:DUF742 domain-containing protein [Micromonosporaceae bacterium]
MSSELPGSHHDWLDADAGPVVRPYTMTGGRVRPEAGAFDLVAFVVAGAPPSATDHMQPEHRSILLRAQKPVSVAELAAHLDLALGVVRVLLGDLLAAGLIDMHEPPASPRFPHDDMLKAVVHGLRSL